MVTAIQKKYDEVLKSTWADLKKTKYFQYFDELVNTIDDLRTLGMQARLRFDTTEMVFVSAATKIGPSYIIEIEGFRFGCYFVEINNDLTFEIDESTLSDDMAFNKQQRLISRYNLMDPRDRGRLKSLVMSFASVYQILRERRPEAFVLPEKGAEQHESKPVSLEKMRAFKRQKPPEPPPETPPQAEISSE